jgi:hypothetical protein
MSEVDTDERATAEACLDTSAAADAATVTISDAISPADTPQATEVAPDVDDVAIVEAAASFGAADDANGAAPKPNLAVNAAAGLVVRFPFSDLLISGPNQV